MYMSTLSLKHASVLLPLLLYLPIQVLSSGLEARQIGSLPGDDECDEAPTSDGATSDKSAGIGVEFETGQIQFGSENCNGKATQASKGYLVNDRQGTDWLLTGDFASAGVLNAEYILLGTQIKIGSGDAGKAAGQVAADIAAWNPSAEEQNNVYNILTSTCNPWKIVNPDNGAGYASFKWAPQITAPLPLEAISDLFSKAVSTEDSALLPSIRPVSNMVYVTTEFFQSSPNGISSSSVKPDTLGFFSLVLTYAKGASNLDGEQSAKHIGSIMPRTDFTTIFDQVRSAVPGTLYQLVKVLACYKNDGNSVALDETFCSGTVAAPVPNSAMDQQEFLYDPGTKSLMVQAWMTSIQNKVYPDALTTFDVNFNGQVGGLGPALENVLNTNRGVPLFEFRRLPGTTQPNMVTFVNNAEQAIIAYHNADPAPPRLVRRRLDGRYNHMKRQGIPDVCTVASTNPTATTPTASEAAPVVQTSAAPIATALPARWSYEFHTYTGNIQSGNFSFFILPGKFNGDFTKMKRSLEEPEETLDTLPSEIPKRELDAREVCGRDSVDKRQCGDPPPTSLPTTNGQVWVWTQNGNGATIHGPFVLDCTQSQGAWQSYQPESTGLNYILEVQSGHACAFDAADDSNLDNLHVRYAAQYVDVPTGLGDGDCVEHDNGVSCNSFTD